MAAAAFLIVWLGLGRLLERMVNRMLEDVADESRFAADVERRRGILSPPHLREEATGSPEEIRCPICGEDHRPRFALAPHA